MGKFNVRATDAPQGTIVKIDGDVTVEEVDDLERHLHALAALGPKSYVLDLSGTSFAASLAIGCMLRFRNEIAAAGGRVVLADVQPLVRESFRHAQLHRVFSIYDSVNEALGQIAVN